MSKFFNLSVLHMLLFTFLVISQSLLTSARPLTVDHRRAATTPELDLALPGALPDEFDSDNFDGVEVNKQKVPCAVSSSNGEVRLLKRFDAGNYGSLFLSALPKGSPLPPSGPSKRTNDENN